MFDVEPADDAFAETWDAWSAAHGGGPYHRFGWLRAAEAESGGTLVPLVCRQGEAVVGLWPVFLLRRGVTAVVSPPPGCAVPALGPVLAAEDGPRYTAEKEQGRVLGAFLAHLDDVLGPDLVELQAVLPAADARPFLWRGYAAEPLYTYAIGLEGGADAAFAAFKKQTRTDARRATRYPELAVADGDAETYRTVCRMVRERYAAQGIDWAPSETYLDRVYAALGPEQIRTKVVVREGEVLAGLVLLADGRRGYHWLGGLQYDADYIGLNEWLHWEAIRSFAAEGYAAYELVGANTERLCRSKAKFDPALEVYFRLQRSTRLGRVARWAAGQPALRRALRAVRTR